MTAFLGQELIALDLKKNPRAHIGDIVCSELSHSDPRIVVWYFLNHTKKIIQHNTDRTDLQKKTKETAH